MTNQMEIDKINQIKLAMVIRQWIYVYTDKHFLHEQGDDGPTTQLINMGQREKTGAINPL